MLIIEIKVVPNAGRQSWQIDKNGILKCFLKSAPEKGKANKELVKFIARSLDVPQQEVEIIAGLSSRKKRIRISADLTYECFLRKIGLVRQMPLF